VPAELAGQRPLLERAATGDREAFALLYDTQVTGVYRYLLAWTGRPAEAADLTAQVFHSATGWLPTTTGPEGEASAWLTAMSRDALAQRQAAAGPGGGEVAAGDMVAAVTRLRNPEREVAILRLLLGHSLDHTAHLSGYSRRAAMELQLAACLAIHEVTVGPPPGDDALSGPPGTAATGALMGGDLSGRARAATPPEAHTAPSAEEFERRLGLREVDLTGSDPTLADSLTSMDPAVAGALTAASALRRAAPEHVADPPSEFVQRLRRELVTAPGAVDSREHLPTGSATFPLRGLNNRGSRIRVPQLHLRRRRLRIRPLRSSPLRRRSRGCAHPSRPRRRRWRGWAWCPCPTHRRLPAPAPRPGPGGRPVPGGVIGESWGGWAGGHRWRLLLPPPGSWWS
jgi:DNA-directed RNA polymerase specialized sigma24 family protein